MRAVTECAGNDGEFFTYLREGSNVKKPSLRVKQNEEGGWNQMAEEGQVPNIDDILEAISTTCLVSGGEWTGVPLREVLNRAGVKDSAVAIRVQGWDTGRPDPVTQYLSWAGPTSTSSIRGSSITTRACPSRRPCIRTRSSPGPITVST